MRIATLLATQAAAWACGEEYDVDPIGPVSETDPGPIDETGEFEGSGPMEGADVTGDPQPWPTCFVEDDEVSDGFVYQCGGEGQVLFTYEADNVDFEFPHERAFGHEVDDDPYEHARVIACCDSLLVDVDFEEQPHFEVCYADWAALACNNLPNVVYERANAETDPDRRNEFFDMFDYVSDNAEQCAENLYLANMPYDPTTTTASYTWVLPDTYPNIDEATFEFTWQIDDFWIPASNPRTCDSYADNNNEAWSTGGDGPSGFTLSSTQPDGVLLGPSLSGGTVAARGDLDSPSNLLKFDWSATAPSTLKTLAVYATDSFNVGNDDLTVPIEGFHIQLLSPVSNLTSTSTGFGLGAGKGLFMVMGTGGGLPYALVVKNATKITFTKNPTNGNWATNSFGMQYVDSTHRTWNFTVSSATWSP